MSKDVETLFRHPDSGDMLPAVWTDKAGKTHRAVGAEVHRGIRLLWPACGKGDVPANAAKFDDGVDCPACLSMLTEETGNE